MIAIETMIARQLDLSWKQRPLHTPYDYPSLTPRVVMGGRFASPHTSHLTPHTSHLTPHTSHLTPYQTLNLQDLRRNYTFGSLLLESLPPSPLTLFQHWWTELQSLDLPEWFEANAMTLSTRDAEEGVASRIVLLKGLDEGFCFFTNYNSAKGKQLASHSQAALNFFWPCLERQVRVVGNVEKTSTELSDQYFAARPRSSQLGAVASPQSEVLDRSTDLQQEVEKLDAMLAGKEVLRPDFWGGYRLIPTSIEFWQGRPSRLHDRYRYRREDRNGAWIIERLAP